LKALSQPNIPLQVEAIDQMTPRTIDSNKDLKSSLMTSNSGSIHRRKANSVKLPPVALEVDIPSDLVEVSVIHTPTEEYAVIKHSQKSKRHSRKSSASSSVEGSTTSIAQSTVGFEDIPLSQNAKYSRGSSQSFSTSISENSAPIDILEEVHKTFEQLEVHLEDASVTEVETQNGPFISVTEQFEEPKKIARRSTISTIDRSISMTRPRHLPPKDKNEEGRHLREYQKMMKQAKEKEQKRLMQLQKKREAKEQHLIKSLNEWKDNILPNWNTKRNESNTLSLWKKGLHPKIRGQVWFNSIHEEMNIPMELFDICVEKSTDIREIEIHGKDFSLIDQDLDRTFPELQIFQANAPLNHSLRNLLYAFICFRPDIGYVIEFILFNSRLKVCRI
jgi:hypothetical protein